MSESVLEVRDLRVSFPAGRSRAVVVDGVSFSLGERETVGLVGESGCGKSVSCLSILGLLDPRARRSGSILFEGADLAQASERRMRSIRGDRIAMIFQEPMTALNPLQRVGDQIDEPLLLHRGAGGKGGARGARERARENTLRLLGEVGIPDPPRIARLFPHELSGGMRQRAMIAMALALNPRVIIADEPTTALDVTIQAQILQLLGALSAAHGSSVLLVTHDLGVVAETCDRVIVMYAGLIVEEAPAAEFFAAREGSGSRALSRGPLHPYAEGLIASVPTLEGGSGRLASIPGSVPLPADMPAGCRFAPRCANAFGRCADPPPLFEAGPGRRCRCWLYAAPSAGGPAAGAGPAVGAGPDAPGAGEGGAA